MSARVVALRCRTSDRTAGGRRGAEALAELLGERLGVQAGRLGEPAEPRSGGWEEDLAAARECLASAGATVSEALSAGELPVLLASDCTLCLATLPAVAEHEPEVRVAWLDAHGDFNTPRTTASGFLGGMCLAGACGRWDAGAGPLVPASAVVLCGARDVDPGEAEELRDAGVRQLADPRDLADVLAGQPVYVHLDLDVLDPVGFPAQFAAPGGPSPDEVRAGLRRLADMARVVGIEVTAFEAPEEPAERARLARLALAVMEPLLPS